MAAGSASPAMAPDMVAATSSQATGSGLLVAETGSLAAGLGFRAAPIPLRPSRACVRKQAPIKGISVISS
ncbi:hypothetical protein EJB05_05700, partial [Eragrostis curvula]